MIFLVCGTPLATTCVVASTKSNCDTATASCFSSFYTGTYWAFNEVNGQLMYAKQATINGVALPNQYIYIFFVPEINYWTVSKMYGYLFICMAT